MAISTTLRQSSSRRTGAARKRTAIVSSRRSGRRNSRLSQFPCSKNSERSLAEFPKLLLVNVDLHADRTEGDSISSSSSGSVGRWRTENGDAVHESLDLIQP